MRRTIPIATLLGGFAVMIVCGAAFQKSHPTQSRTARKPRSDYDRVFAPARRSGSASQPMKRSAIDRSWYAKEVNQSIQASTSQGGTNTIEPVAPAEYAGDVRNLPQVPAKPNLDFELEEPVSTKKAPARLQAEDVANNVPLATMPAPTQSFAGLSGEDFCNGGPCGAGWPPDINGDVGLNHYIEAVNDAWAIYNKSGTLLASFTEDSLWSGVFTGTPCDGDNRGDPVVVYDQINDRWILSNFAFAVDSLNDPIAPFYQCFAVSRTSDPISGGWWLYSVQADSGLTNHPPPGTLNDYPKFGIWNDGCLYMSANEFSFPAGQFSGTLFASFNISDMESGAPLTGGIGFINNSSNPFTMIPSNLSGAKDSGSLPPAGTPNYFVSESQTAFSFEVRKFTPGTTPKICGGGGTLGSPANVTQTSYSGPADIPQPNTTNTLASLGDRLMQKVQYRKIGAAESLWVVHSVQSSAGTTVRPEWAQINVSGGTVVTTPVQQQIYAPDTTLNRWMGSIAADHDGNVALGYSTANGLSPNFPSIAYSGRLVGDPLNQLSQGETQLIAGLGSQRNTCGGKPCIRWGDYTAMSVDPADDCTFWYTSEYYDSQVNGDAGNWQTRIGSFRFPGCGGVVVTTRTLTVNSSNPTSGVSITVTPNDNSNLGSGATQFTRIYNSNTSVTLTAPATASVNNFQKWQRDGVDWSTNASTSVSMDTNHTMTAVYGTPTRALTVSSSNPASGVSITVTPADNSNLGNGNTPFNRTYNINSSVSLTAPATAGGNNFQKWQRDGSDWSTNRATSVTMDANHTMTAVYVFPPRTLTVSSTNPASGVSITVSPLDNGNLGNGATSFTRTYGNNTIVSLTAPATAGSNNFQKWQRDGVDWATTVATTVTMSANHVMTAVYVPPTRTLTVASSNPSGVSITVSPVDNGGLGGGTTQFTRTYNINTIVALTAPATASGNNFQKWQRDGTDWATTAATTVTMDANHTMTAVYVTPTRTLTVASSNPNSGVSITVSPNDNSNLGNGATQFTRTYNNNVIVNLTAPATAGGNPFQKWQRDGVDLATTAATSVTMNANHTMTAIYASPTIQITVQTNPAGRGFSVDGASFSSTQTFSWTPGSSHTIATTSPQSGTTGTQFVWSNWSDSGLISHIVAPTTATTYTANFTTQFMLTMAGGSGGTVSPASGFFNGGQSVNISATPNSNFAFSGWTGTGTGSFTGATNPVAVTMNGPITETAAFTLISKTLQFSASSYSVNEGNGSVNLTVTRSGDVSAAASVAYTTSNGTAKEGKDYVASQGTLNFGPGETSKTFTVLVIDNAFVDLARTVNLALNNPSGGALGATSSAVLTVIDNDLIPGANPLDTARSFVQFNYYDFLNRFPDQSGWDFWTNQITACGPNTSCTDVARINTSGAFFLSIEFQQTGYLVERMYKTAYGDASRTSTFGGSHTLLVPIVRFSEFLQDTQRIGRGVVVLQPGWEALLESNKQAYASEFVQTSRFVTAFPTTMTPAEFVATLNLKAGNVLSTSERNAVISLFGAAADTSNVTARAQAVRQVAENANLAAAEKNRAFVLAQYFGYLRRDPNASPDTDYTGYDFWLTKLNQFNGDYIAAEMVKAFIASGEYRQRFGP